MITFIRETKSIMKTSNLKQGVFVAVIVASMIACNKKKETTSPETTEETPTVTCFNSQNNGTYIGSGVTTSSPFTSGTLTVTRTSCQVVNLNLTTNTAGQIIDQASQLVLNSSGGYDGKQNNGNNITLTFGSVLNINAIGSYSYSGSKQ